MIGFVSPSLQPLVHLRLRVEGAVHEIEAVIDTGFTGFLTLPPNLIAELKIARLSEVVMKVADGSEVSLRTFRVETFLDDVWSDTEVIETENTPLLGMSFLENHQLTIEVRDGGAVSVQTL